MQNLEISSDFSRITQYLGEFSRNFTRNPPRIPRNCRAISRAIREISRAISRAIRKNFRQNSRMSDKRSIVALNKYEIFWICCVFFDDITYWHCQKSTKHKKAIWSILKGFQNRINIAGINQCQFHKVRSRLVSYQWFKTYDYLNKLSWFHDFSYIIHIELIKCTFQYNGGKHLILKYYIW